MVSRAEGLPYLLLVIVIIIILPSWECGNQGGGGQVGSGGGRLQPYLKSGVMSIAFNKFNLNILKLFLIL